MHKLTLSLITLLVLSSCGGTVSTIITIDKKAMIEGLDYTYSSDTFSAKEKENFTIEFSYEIVPEIAPLPGATFAVGKNDIWEIDFFDINSKIEVEYNGQLLQKFNGNFYEYFDLILNKPTSVRNTFLPVDFESYSNDEYGSVIFLYHPYKNKKDKIKFKLSSVTKIDNVHALYMDKIIDLNYLFSIID